jgi:hypothetical protein
MMSVARPVESELAEESEVPGEILPHCYFVHHKSNMV